MRTALIDADILTYEVGFCGQYVDEEGIEVIRSFEFVSELLDETIEKIREGAWCDDVVLYLTYGKHLNKLANKEAVRQGLPPYDYKPNFRFDAAVTHPYKDRGNKKPYHFHNIIAYMLGNYRVKVVEGIEADDAICVDREQGVICTRDKDLRMVNGKHFGWECGHQPGFPLQVVKGVGSLDLQKRTNGSVLLGTGYKFFSAQRLMGDPVDSIKGLRGYGPVKVFGLLDGLTTKEELDACVEREWENRIGDGWEQRLEEVSHLLWMIQEKSEEGYVGWNGKLLPYDTGSREFRWNKGSFLAPRS